MLEKEKFLAIKKLARDIREDNSKLFKTLSKESVDKAVKDKDDFIKSVIEKMDIHFSDGEEGKEEEQIFRANILIPDDEEFYESYSKDKNIRNLMNKYAVSIEDIMNKIKELNLYEKYIEEFSEKSDDLEEDVDFVSEMTKISPKKAEDLLDEIESLSEEISGLDIKDEKEYDKSELLTPEKDVKKETKTSSKTDPEFDDMTATINNFIDNYNNVQKDYTKQTETIKDLQTNIDNLQKELDKAQTETKKANDQKDKLDDEITKLTKENEDLQAKNKDLEEKLAKTTSLLQKIYQSIKK